MSYIDGLGERLKIERIKSSFSQKIVAERVGVTERSISSYERGEVVPPADVIIKLATLYRCTTDYLYGIERMRGIETEGLGENDIAVLDYLARRLGENK